MVINDIELFINDKLIDIKNILSVNFTDRAGSKSDRVTIKTFPNFPRPKPNDKIKLFFKRYEDNQNIKLKYELNCGLFHIQTVTRSNNQTLSFSATGVEFNDNQKIKNSQLYTNTKLSNIVNIVAKRLNHKVKFSSDDFVIKSLSQTNESDINFLDRLALDYNVLFSIKNDFIYFVNKDDKTLPKVTIKANGCKDINITHSSKTHYKSCEASWYDNLKAKKQTVTVGNGTPVLKIKDSFNDKEEAMLKAKAKLTQSKKGIVRGSLTHLGLKVYAGTKLDLVDTYNNEDDKIYSIESINHTWSRSSGWLTKIEFEN